MKSTVSSVTTLLFIVLGLMQALIGQTLPSRQATFVHSNRVRGLSTSEISRASNFKAVILDQSHDNPDASPPRPRPTVFFRAATRTSFDFSSTVYPVVGGDFNGDKLTDVVTLAQNAGSPTGTYLTVLLNVAGTPFATPIFTPVSFTKKDFIIVADVNKDGKDDVVLVHPNSMDVLLSMGDGTFASPVSVPTGINSPVAARFWDVNRDSLLDVVIVDGVSTQAAFLLGNGQGGFAAPHVTAFPGQTTIAVLADVDSDGNLDVVTNSALYPGNGQGGFLSGIPFQNNDGQNAGALVSDSVGVGDINGDGLLDVVTANGFWNTISVFRNHGGRTLVQQGSSLWSGNNPTAISLADLNWDGKADLVVTNAAESDLSVFLGNGDGTFLPPTGGNTIGGTPSTRALLADFNGDGDLDIALSDNQSSVVLALGFGDGTFQSAPASTFVVAPGSSNLGGSASIASADFNGDGIPDFVVGESSSTHGMGLTVFLTQSNGNLAKGVAYAPNDTLGYVAVGDLSHNGKADIVASNWALPAVEILAGNGDGTFRPPTLTPIPGLANGLVIGDFNGDGWPDVALAGTGAVVYILLNDGTGSLVSAGTYPISGSGYKLTAVDINNDGKLDLCVAMTSTSRVAILLGNGNGAFSAAPDYDTTIPSPYGIAAGDLNRDGFIDLVTTSPTGAALAVAFGKGDGSFNSPQILHASSLLSLLNPAPGEVTLSDLNGDGNMDIVFANSGYGSVGVLLSDSVGDFFGPYEFPTGGGALAVATADLNKDGMSDIVTADVHFSGVSVLYNTSAAKPTADFAIGANPTTLRVAPTGSVTTAISVSSLNLFVGSVQLQCQNLPKTLTCAFAPSAVHVVEGGAVSSRLTIISTPANASMFGSGRAFMALAMISMLGGMMLWRTPRAISKTALVALLASSMILSGCQGLAPAKIAPQTYSVTVTGLGWSGGSHSVQLQVTVQQ
jgi:FG-GAP-like repeat